MQDIENVRRIVRIALDEDFPAGDITTDICVSGDKPAFAKIVAREDLIFCGGPLLSIIFDEARSRIKIATVMPEGSQVSSGAILATLSGQSADLLKLERTILNFLQRLCGVATYTHAVVEKAQKLQILDTRKTMPGYRYLDKYAVRIGGGRNHRGSLSDMILVKNNHIDAHPNGLTGVLEDVFRKKPVYMAVEVEVRNLEELRAAIDFPVSVIMLDNFDDSGVKDAMSVLSKSNPRPFVEVSGGITPDRFAALSACGIDGVSMGALTTRAPNVDISMKLSKAK